MTKAEIIAEMMRTLKMRDEVEFESDNRWYMATKKDGNYFLKGVGTCVYYQNASELKKAIAKTGPVIIEM